MKVGGHRGSPRTRTLDYARDRLRWTLFCGLFAGCSCGAPGWEDPNLRTEGPHPFVRCLEAAPPDFKRWRTGIFQAAIDGGDLRLDPMGLGKRSPHVRAAFLGGSALGSPSYHGNGLGLEEAELLVVLGSLGDTRARAQQRLKALAQHGPAVLFVPGGRDDLRVVHSALEGLTAEERSQITPAVTLRRILIHGVELAVLPGAPHGRYARTPWVCGFDAADVERRAQALGPPSNPRWVVAWAAPDRLGRGWGGGDPGEPLIRQFMRLTGARGGVFAWPRMLGGTVRSGSGARASEFVVSHVGGPGWQSSPGASIRAEPTWLELGPGGVRPAPRD